MATATKDIQKLILLIMYIQLASLKTLHISYTVRPPVDLDKLKCLFNAGYWDEVFVDYAQSDDGSWYSAANITQIK